VYAVAVSALLESMSLVFSVYAVAVSALLESMTLVFSVYAVAVSALLEKAFKIRNGWRSYFECSKI
jgi:hypothetical protein